MNIVITTAYLAKGLEFDKVLVPFCTSENYQQPIDRHMLYIAVTRAMHSLVITHCGAITEFLETAIRTPQPCVAESCV